MDIPGNDDLKSLGGGGGTLHATAEAIAILFNMKSSHIPIRIYSWLEAKNHTPKSFIAPVLPVFFYHGTPLPYDCSMNQIHKWNAQSHGIRNTEKEALTTQQARYGYVVVGPFFPLVPAMQIFRDGTLISHTKFSRVKLFIFFSGFLNKENLESVHAH